MTNTTAIVSPNENEATLPGQADDDKLTKEVLENLRRARSHMADWRLQARSDFDFYAGVQWDEVDRRHLEDEGRPPVVFNRIVRTINAVAGVEVQNRQEVRYFPRHIDNTDPQDPKATNDVGFTDMLNGAAKWVREQNNSEDEESDAFTDLLICGIGLTLTRMNYEKDMEGMIEKDRLDPLQLLIDPDSTKRNFTDAKFIAYEKGYSRKEVKEMFPDFDLEGYEQGGSSNDSDVMLHDADDAWKYINDQSDRIVEVGKISVVQYQFYRKETVHIVLAPSGKMITLTRKKFNKLRQVIEAQGLKTIKASKRIYKQMFLVGNRIADKITDLDCNDFTLQAMTGIRDRNRNLWFGLVAIMQDPQRWANKWLSQIQHILNTNSKGGVMVETGAVVNMREFESDWASPDGIVKLNPGGLDKIREKEMARYPDGIDKLLQYAVNAINDVPGVSLEMIGMANRDQANVLEQSRKQSGITVLANFFDALRRYRKEDGRLLAYFIREYIADGRLIRIIGETGAKYIPLIKDKLAFEYDIVVDDAPTSPNVKERTFAILSTIIPLCIQSGVPIPPQILEYAPLPDDLVQKWKLLIAQQANQKPDPTVEEMKKIQLLEAKLRLLEQEATIGKIGSETQKNYATAEKDKSVGEEQSALAAQKFGLIQGQHDAKVDSMQQDQARKDTEMWMNQYRKMLEVQLENKLKHHKLNSAPSLNTIQ